MHKGYIPKPVARKILHIIAISLCAVSVYYIPHSTLFWTTAATIPILFVLIKIGFYSYGPENKTGWGIFYFAVVFLFLLFLFPKKSHLIFYPLLILAWADGVSTLVGTFFGKHKYTFGSEIKSWEGSIAFFLISVLCFQVVPQFIPFVDPPFTSFASVLIVSLFMTLIEGLSIKHRDNIWIPLALVYWLMLDMSSINYWYVGVVLGLAVVLVLTIKVRWLSTSGAAAAFILGCLLLVSPKPIWVIPALFFFVVGSSFSFLPKRNPLPQIGGRTSKQVFFSGGVAIFFTGLFFLSNELGFLIAGLSALAAGLSDTASSEIGSRYSKKTVSIILFKEVTPGLSGGVSMIGWGAGFVFAILFSAVSMLILGKFSFILFLIIVIAALAGNLTDSVLGSFLQAKYRKDSVSPWSDFPTDSPDQEMCGFKFVNNEYVNFMASIFAAFLGLFLYYIH